MRKNFFALFFSWKIESWLNMPIKLLTVIFEYVMFYITYIFEGEFIINKLKTAKMFFVISLILPIMLSEGFSFSATHSISSDNHIKSNNQLIAAVPAKSSSSTEKKIEAALSNKTTDLFQISGDYTFKSDVRGVTTLTKDAKTSETNMSIKSARTHLSASTKGVLIRIKNGKATMDDSSYDCTMNILSKNQGISLSITRISSAEQEQIDGTIKGNTFTALGKNIISLYSPRDKSIAGSSVSGSYSVSMIEVPKNNWPPAPVTLSGKENSDHSITLTWEDTNPAGLVKSYVIYRALGQKYVNVATVSNCRQWTDSSTAAKTETEMLFYYVTAQNSSGKVSIISNITDIDITDRWVERWFGTY
jgi:hypothetical protein